MVITTKKYKFNTRFIDILDYCIYTYGDIERLDSNCSYSIYNILNIIKQISPYNKKKYYYDVPNELKRYFEQKNNISNVAYTIYIIKYFVNKEILVDKVDKKFLDTYITIGNYNDYTINKFTVYI